jgi:hypothetical protein
VVPGQPLVDHHGVPGGYRRGKGIDDQEQSQGALRYQRACDEGHAMTLGRTLCQLGHIRLRG